jgi:FKBP-type peptidyl-prolyl cis-trans isomerase
MRSVILGLPAMLLGIGLLSCDSDSAGGGGAMTTIYDSVSYAIGMNSGSGLKDLMEKDSIELDVDMLVQGLRDAMSGTDLRLSDSVAQQVLMTFQMEMQAKAQEKSQADGETNLKKGNDFLAENRGKEGIQVTESGLQYKVLEEGSGESPDENDEVTVEYRGTLIDGTEFDASQAGSPVTFGVNMVIPGWTEALQLMKPGSRYQFFIPAELAYGESGSPPKIGPNEALIFEVKLVSVAKK